VVAPLFAAAHVLFFFSSRRRHTRSKRDWSSDVCSSDLRTDRHRELVDDAPALGLGTDASVVVLVDFERGALVGSLGQSCVIWHVLGLPGCRGRGPDRHHATFFLRTPGTGGPGPRIRPGGRGPKRRGCLPRRTDRYHGSPTDDRVYAEKRTFTHTEDWEVDMAEEKIDVELQDTGEFLASIHTRTGTEEIVLMFSDVEDVSQGALNNDEATARAAVEFL